MTEFKTIIGLEIHAQLSTKSKMFCGCDNNAEDKEPNTVVCPICFGMPGTLPVPNREAIKKTIKLGLALGCEIPKISKFDRKHYFYPDLPKGYQISQYDMPFCRNGKMELKDESGKLKVIRINRVHLEEDAGKLIHPKGSNFTVVDLNRAGTPLMEIVSEPDITSPEMAKEYMQSLHEIVRAVGVSDADMEKGHMRCDANISVTTVESGRPAKLGMVGPKGKVKSSPIVEIKNLNSFRFVEKALAYEEKRLREKYDNWPAKQTKITRGFDADSGKTFAMREKEEAKDYRYFPEPDVPPFDLTKFPIEKWRGELPKLPSHHRAWLSELGLTKGEAAIISKDDSIKDLVENVAEENKGIIGKMLINNPEAKKISVEDLNNLAELLRKKIPSNILRQVISAAVASGDLPTKVYEKLSADSVDLSSIVAKVLKENPDAIAKYKSGKTEVLGFLIGHVMQKTQGKADPNEVSKELTERMKDK